MEKLELHRLHEELEPAMSLIEITAKVLAQLIAEFFKVEDMRRAAEARYLAAQRQDLKLVPDAKLDAIAAQSAP